MALDDLNRLKILIAENTCLEVDEIHAELQLERDLYLSGDEAVEFLLLYSDEFNVDLSGLNIREYITDEGLQILVWLLKLLRIKKVRPIELKVAHLELGVKERRLNNEMINSSS